LGASQVRQRPAGGIPLVAAIFGVSVMGMAGAGATSLTFCESMVAAFQFELI
jgi:hypothetical protein